MSKQKNADATAADSEKSGERYLKAVHFFEPAVKFLWQIDVRQMPELPESGCVICPNHMSIFDIPVICVSFPEYPLRYMAKKELFKTPLLGRIFSSLGAYPINRGAVDITSIKTAVSLAENGEKLVIFPQGHRNPGLDPKDTEVHGGPLLIAQRAGVPVLPVYIRTKKHRVRLFSRTEVIPGRLIYPDEFAGYGDKLNDAMKNILTVTCSDGGN